RRAGRARRPRDLARRADEPGARGVAPGLPPLDRRARRAYPRRRRGRPAAPAPHSHPARRGLRVRTPPGRGRERLMRGLFVQIFATVIGIIVLLVVVIAIGWHPLGRGRSEERRAVSGVAAVLGRALPPPDAPPAEQQSALEALARDFDVRLTLRAADGRVLASSGAELPPPPSGGRGPLLGGMRHNQLALRLPDGRTLSVAGRREPAGGIFMVIALASAIALGAYPVVRRITHRLERLREQVDALGAGELSARVEVRGKDEIASLAASFNHAAERIERLVTAPPSTPPPPPHQLPPPPAPLPDATPRLHA